MRSIHGILAYSVDSLDPLVRAFVTAANITDPVIRLALNVFVLTLRSNNLLSKFDAIYPFVGGTAFRHKFNLINAADTNAAFRLQFFGGYVHNTNGINPNGINTWADTFYKETDHSLLNDKHISVYSRTNSLGLTCEIGASGSTSVLTDTTDIIPRYNQGGADRTFMRNSSQSGNFLSADSLGFYLNNRISSTEVRARKNSTLNVVPNVSTGLVPWNYYINSTNAANTAGFRSARNISFASIGRGFSDAESLIVYNAVQTLQTDLSRQV